MGQLTETLMVLMMDVSLAQPTETRLDKLMEMRKDVGLVC
jgi:hypothetical protein